jgi:hypothetical protein
MGAASEVSGKAYYLYYNALRTVYTRLDDFFIWFVRVQGYTTLQLCTNSYCRSCFLV